MATINIIESDAMEQDNDSGSWLQRRLIVTKIFPIKQLSPPLVIANEHTKIWFLDIIIPQYGTQVINAHSREVMSGLKSLSTIILLYLFPTVFNRFAAAVPFSSQVFPSTFLLMMVW